MQTLKVHTLLSTNSTGELYEAILLASNLMKCAETVVTPSPRPHSVYHTLNILTKEPRFFTTRAYTHTDMKPGALCRSLSHPATETLRVPAGFPQLTRSLRIRAYISSHALGLCASASPRGGVLNVLRERERTQGDERSPLVCWERGDGLLRRRR